MAMRATQSLIINDDRHASNEIMSSLYANQGFKTRHSSSEARQFRRGDNRFDVLVGARRLLRDATGRRAPYQNAIRGEIIDNLAATPELERCMAGEATPGAVAGR